MTNDELKARIARSMELHARGYNCAQAVACTFCDKTDFSEETIFCMTEGLGRGMGGMDATCGAISGACVLAGLKNCTAHLDAPDSKLLSYDDSERCINAFKEKNGTLICRELKGIDTGTPLKTCDEYIADAVAIVAETLFK